MPQEFIEFELEQAFPGLHSFDYQMIAYEAKGDLQKALSDGKAAHLEMVKQKSKSVNAVEEAIWA